MLLTSLLNKNIHEIMDIDFDKFEDFNCFIFVKNVQGKYLYSNRVLATYSQFNEPKDLLGLTDFDASILSLEDAQMIRTNDQIILKQNKQKFFLENIKHYSNENFYSHKAPLHSRTKRNAGIMGVTFIETAVQYPEEIHLTNKQLDCLFYLTKGMTSKEISEKVHLSFRTTQHYLDAIKIKLNCYSRSELVAKALAMPCILNRITREHLANL